MPAVAISILACRSVHTQLERRLSGAVRSGDRLGWRSESAITPAGESYSGLKAPQTHRVRTLSLLALALSDAIAIDCKSAQIVA